MPLPENFVADNLREAGSHTLFGVKLSDMTRDELMACAVAGWKAERRALDSAHADREFLLSIGKP